MFVSIGARENGHVLFLFHFENSACIIFSISRSFNLAIPRDPFKNSFAILISPARNVSTSQALRDSNPQGCAPAAHTAPVCFLLVLEPLHAEIAITLPLALLECFGNQGWEQAHLALCRGAKVFVGNSLSFHRASRP